MLRIILLEIEDILDLRSAEGIDRLGVVTHHAKVLMELTELLEYQILRKVGILILIDHYIVESLETYFINLVGDGKQ